MGSRSWERRQHTRVLPHDTTYDRPSGSDGDTRQCSLTSGEARCFDAWLHLRKLRPHVQPSMAELATVMGVSQPAAYKATMNLLAKGYVVRLPGSGKHNPRCYAVSVDAAFNLQRAALARLCKGLAKLRPSECGDPDSESARLLAELHVEARSVLGQVLKMCRVLQGWGKQEANTSRH